MHSLEFIEDLAIIMLISGVISVLFHKLRQPVVLGYIIAGLIIGPNTPPFALISNEEIIKTLAELGVVFLMFSLGLEFSFRNLAKVGVVVTITALAEIILMMWLGYNIGMLFNWSTIDSIFLGAILAISSSTIIVKALRELKLEKEYFVQYVYGILIVEDLLGIALLALLSSIAISGSFGLEDIAITFGKLSVFLGVTLIVGLLTIPKILTYVANFHSREILLITVLGLCFGFCLLVIKLDYSIALGAFIIGAIIAECKELKLVEKIIDPIKNMFSAIFFVSVGLLLDPGIVVKYAFPIFIITLAVIIGKVLSCSLGVILTGKDSKTSLQVGMSLAQIGEFSFIIAALGVSLNVTSGFLYPIAVAVSIITTFTTPYLIKSSDGLAQTLNTILPQKFIYIFKVYREWLEHISSKDSNYEIKNIVNKGLINIVINLIIIAAIFLISSYFATTEGGKLLKELTNPNIQKAIIWGFALIISMPFIIAIYRKSKGLSMLLSEVNIDHDNVGKHIEPQRRLISQLIPVATIIGIIFFILALSASILPTLQLFIFTSIFAILVLILLGRWFIKLHSKLQIALTEAMHKKNNY